MAAVVTSTANAAVKAARKLARRDERERTGLVLAEGPQAVGDARGLLRRLFATPEARGRLPGLIATAAAAGAEIVEVSDRVLETLSTTVTPQGVVGVAELPRPDLEATLAAVGSGSGVDPGLDPGAAPLVVVLVGAQDPGNVGAVVRSADAAGADAVVLTEGSVDPGNPKAVRASAGSVFHLPVVTGPSVDTLVRTCRAHGLQLVAAAPRATVAFEDVDLTGAVALLFGNEAAGLEPQVLGLCDVVAGLVLHERRRPGYEGSAESLNLAATVAVCVYEAARQRSGSPVR